MSKYSNGKGSSSQEGQKTIVPKPEMLDFDFPEDALYSRHVGVCITKTISHHFYTNFFLVSAVVVYKFSIFILSYIPLHTDRECISLSVNKLFFFFAYLKF